LVLLDDVIVAFGAGIATASLIILLVLLSRYRLLVKDATRSSDLAKNLWDAMNSRLTTQDTRIVDLMAKVEVYQVRNRPQLPTPAAQNPPATSTPRPVSRPPAASQQPSQRISQLVAAPPQSGIATDEHTETRILRVLTSGPKTAPQIVELVGTTREHTGRLMKQLFTRGLVIRNDQNKPYVYEITDDGRRQLGGTQE